MARTEQRISRCAAMDSFSDYRKDRSSVSGLGFQNLSRINGQMVYEAFPRSEEGSDTAFTLYLSTDKLSGAGDGWKSSRTAEKRLKKYMIMK